MALLEENCHLEIVGGCRYILGPSGQAEVAFAIDEAHQGQGIGTVVMRHLANIARSAGLKGMTTDVLPDNTAMLKILRKSGLGIEEQRESGSTHLVLHLS